MQSPTYCSPPSPSLGNAGDNKFRLVHRKNIRAAAIPPITKSIGRIRRRLKRGGGTGIGTKIEAGHHGRSERNSEKRILPSLSSLPSPPPALTKLQPPHVISQRKPKEEDLNSSSSSPVSEAEAAHTKVLKGEAAGRRFDKGEKGGGGGGVSIKLFRQIKVRAAAAATGRTRPIHIPIPPSPQPPPSSLLGKIPS